MLLEFSTGKPSIKGLYLCRLAEPAVYGCPPHSYAVLEWSGQGSASTMPERWGEPLLARGITSKDVVAWVGPLPEETCRAVEANVLRRRERTPAATSLASDLEMGSQPRLRRSWFSRGNP